LFFFCQAEDGIRDWSVTGVQTCALPILSGVTFALRRDEAFGVSVAADGAMVESRLAVAEDKVDIALDVAAIKVLACGGACVTREIGRASCRERVEIAVVGGALKEKRR